MVIGRASCPPHKSLIKYQYLNISVWADSQQNYAHRGEKVNLGRVEKNEVGDEGEEREKMFPKRQGLKTGTTKYLFMKIGCFNYKKEVKNTKNPEIYIN